MPEEKDMGDVLYVSAKTGEGMDMLAEKIKDCIFKDRVKTEFLIPYDRGDIISRLCDKADVISMEHENEGTRIKGRFSRKISIDTKNSRSKDDADMGLYKTVRKRSKSRADNRKVEIHSSCETGIGSG